LFSAALIFGTNKNNERESNGVGKSTIFKAIDYVLYNIVPTKKFEKIIRDGTNKCIVKFEFENKLGSYRVIRTRNRFNRSDLLLHQYIGNKWINITQKTNSDTEKQLQQLIKISYKAFQNSILFAQGDISGLPSATPQERKALLKEPLQIAIYNKFEKVAKDKLASVIKVLDQRKVLIESLGDPSIDILNIDKEINKTKNDIEYNNLLTTQKQLELSQKKDSLTIMEKLLRSESYDIHKQLFEIENKITDITGSIDKSSKLLGDYLNQLNIYKYEIDKKEKKIKLVSDSFDVLKQKNVRAENEINNDIARLAENEQKGNIIIAKLEAEYSIYDKPIPDSDQCFVCLQPISDEHRQACQEQAIEQKKIIKEKLNDYYDKIKHLIDNKNKLQNELNNLRKYELEFKSVENQLSGLIQDIGKDKKFIDKYSEMISNLNDDKNKSDLLLIELQGKKDNLIKLLSNFSMDDLDEKVTQCKNEIKTIEISIKEMLQINLSLNTSLGIFEDRKRSRENDLIKLSTLKIEHELLNKKSLIQQQVVQAFSSSGIPTLIINTVLDDLQLETNKILKDLRPGMELQFSVAKDNKDTLDIVYKIGGQEREWEQLSGGQKVYVSLSLRLGLSLIIQKRLGVDIKFLELDEVDSQLDNAGIDAMANIIKRWQSKFKIFCITHNDYLKQHFSQGILVDGDEINGATAMVVGW